MLMFFEVIDYILDKFDALGFMIFGPERQFRNQIALDLDDKFGHGIRLSEWWDTGWRWYSSGGYSSGSFHHSLPSTPFLFSGVQPQLHDVINGKLNEDLQRPVGPLWPWK